MKLCMQISANLFSGVQREAPNNACRGELGRCSFNINTQKSVLKLYNLRESDSNTHPQQGLRPQRVTPRRETERLPQPAGAPQHNHHTRQNQTIRTLKGKGFGTLGRVNHKSEGTGILKQRIQRFITPRTRYRVKI